MDNPRFMESLERLEKFSNQHDSMLHRGIAFAQIGVDLFAIDPRHHEVGLDTIGCILGKFFVFRCGDLVCQMAVGTQVGRYFIPTENLGFPLMPFA